MADRDHEHLGILVECDDKPKCKIVWARLQPCNISVGLLGLFGVQVRFEQGHTRGAEESRIHSSHQRACEMVRESKLGYHLRHDQEIAALTIDELELVVALRYHGFLYDVTTFEMALEPLDVFVGDSIVYAAVDVVSRLSDESKELSI